MTNAKIISEYKEGMSIKEIISNCKKNFKKVMYSVTISY